MSSVPRVGAGRVPVPRERTKAAISSLRRSSSLANSEILAVANCSLRRVVDKARCRSRSREAYRSISRLRSVRWDATWSLIVNKSRRLFEIRLRSVVISFTSPRSWRLATCRYL